MIPIDLGIKSQGLYQLGKKHILVDKDGYLLVFGHRTSKQPQLEEDMTMGCEAMQAPISTK